MKVINIFGAPSAGKSCYAAGLFNFLKVRGKKVELVQEFARELIFSDLVEDLKDPCLILGEQFRRIRILSGKVDYVVTDSPILFTAVYACEEEYPHVLQLARLRHIKYPRLNLILPIPKVIQKDEGRVHTEEDQILDIDRRIYKVLGDIKENFIQISRHFPFEEVEDFI